MIERLKRWEISGLLLGTPETRKEFVANSLELLLGYLNLNDDEEREDRMFEILIFPIVVRIGNEIDFNINDLFSIIDEVGDSISDLHHSDKGDDVELLFTQKFCENKINEFKNR